MVKIGGECIIFSSNCTETKSTVIGINSYRPEGEAAEIIHIPSSESVDGKIKCDRIEVDASRTNAVILCRATDIWGCESGANDKGVTVAITWREKDEIDGCLSGSDLARLILERSDTASSAVDNLTSLFTKYNQNDLLDELKLAFIICDSIECWLVNFSNQLWAAEQIQDDVRHIQPFNYSIGSKIDRSSIDLEAKAIELGVWNVDKGEFNFTAAFSKNDSPTVTELKLTEKSNLTETDMFKLLREQSTNNSIGISNNSQVSTMLIDGISCHWFTATPNPKESVFKPFIFTTNAKISPLTKRLDTETDTLLYKLHSTKGVWSDIADLFGTLEQSCVEEVRGFLSTIQEPTAELDELMKDCVEAEVKFYRRT